MGQRLTSAVERGRAGPTSWERFATFVWALGELQAGDPALSELLTHRYPEAVRLSAVCDATLREAQVFIEDAQREGSLRSDFTPEDLFVLLWSNAAVIRLLGSQAPDGWRRGIAITLDGLRTDAASPLPTGALTNLGVSGLS